jgi:hypothetical protein
MFRLLPRDIIRESSWPYELETVAAILFLSHILELRNGF